MKPNKRFTRSYAGCRGNVFDPQHAAIFQPSAFRHSCRSSRLATSAERCIKDSCMNFSALIEHRRPWLRSEHLAAGVTRAAGGPGNSILQRIVAAYRRAKQTEADQGITRGGPWKRILKSHMGELIALLDSGHPEPLNDYLRELAIRHAGHGFFQGKATHDMLHSDESLQRGRLIWIADSIFGLAEWLGVTGVNCPEAQKGEVPRPPTVGDLVARIEAKTKLPLSVPDICGGLFGLAAASGVVHVRSATAVYAAMRIQRLAGFRMAQCRFCEIGPGIGLVAFQLGLLGAGEIVLADLPELNAIQAYFLAQALPQYQLALFGETLQDGGRRIRIQPDFDFLSGTAERFDIIFNQDSLPELELETVERYLDLISHSTRFFLSINQESRVPAGAAEGAAFLPSLLTGLPHVRCLERSPSWLRAGYIDELFSFSDKTLDKKPAPRG